MPLVVAGLTALHPAPPSFPPLLCPPQDQTSLPAPCPKLVDEGRLTAATTRPAAHSGKQPMTGPSSGPGRASRFLAMQQEARKGITASTTTATVAAGQPLCSAAVGDVPESLSLELCTQAELAPADADMAAAAAEGAEEEEEEEVGGSELEEGESTIQRGATRGYFPPPLWFQRTL